MSFDRVHDIQKAYRKVVKCYSTPGDVLSIKDNCQHMDFDIDINKGILSTALMLLDRETSYQIVSKNCDEIQSCITQLTYAVCNKQDGDYIFVLDNSEDMEKIEAIKNSKIGTLIDPHKSATIIFEVDKLNGNPTHTLTGPGIEYSKNVKLAIDEEIITLRNNLNKEYPLGIDCIFVDKEYNIMAIPRTTQVEAVGV